MSILYDNLLKISEEKGISLYKVSKLTGISTSCFASLKTGRTSGMSTKNLKLIADVFGVSVSELTDERTTKKEPPITDSPHSSIDDVIISELNMLDEEKKRKALRFIMNLADE